MTSVKVHREPAFWLVLLLAITIHVPRFTTLTIRGEESRRAVIAREMLDTGDWLVPRTQGEVRLSRPPLQNWMIAALAMAAGEMTTWAVRLPGVIATVLTVGLVYWSARRRLSVTGAVIAAAAYASFFQVLEQGATGETEPVFTLFVSASLLLWHGLWADATSTRVRNWAWVVGGACAALGLLTKGLQPPLYFFGSVWAYLALTRQHAELWRRGHLIGIATFLAIVALWQVPFTLHMGLENGWMIYFRNVAHRFNDNRVTTWIGHFVSYPPSILLGCLAPWSLLLLAFFDPQLRSRLGERKDQALFLTTAIVVCFPTVWLPPEARPRYFMPLFPCFAVLVGIAAELLQEAATTSRSKLWSNYVRLGIAGFTVAALLLPVSSIALAGMAYSIPFGQAVLMSLVLASVAMVLRRSSRLPVDIGMRRAAVAMALGMGLFHIGPIITFQQQNSENLPAAMAELRAVLPADASLKSFGHVHHLFLHHYGKPVELLPKVDDAAAVVPADLEYFCVEVRGEQSAKLPFAWDELAELSMDRNRHEKPKARVIVGRRVADVADAPSRRAGGRKSPQ